MNQEPAPIWLEAPRLCPQRPLPPYRFVPGRSPHPEIDPQGHSYGKEKPVLTHLPTDRWRENETYLFGIDLYHQGYLWESHEAWESLWHLTKKVDAEGQLLQGLIQHAAALLKAHLGQPQAAWHLSQEASRRIQMVIGAGVCNHEGRFMGIHLVQFLAGMARDEQPQPFRLMLSN